MTEPRTCPTCGAALPGDAPRDAGADACPRCLMAAALLESNAGQTEPDACDVPRERLSELFPELELGDIVGRGGMGVVWRARQRNLSRDVALKILTVGGDDAPAFAERFSREARALARLDHENIVRVLECGERQGVCFLLMEFVDGANLREVMRHGDLNPEQALAIVPQICDALQYAHEHGVVHRDIKPENVLIDTAGRVRIADFGLAKLSEGAVHEATLTRAGQVMGTPHYMAPEQIESPLLVDHRADIYSLGVVFYEMLTGELPIGHFDRPSERVHVDVRLDEVVLRALSKRRERRYQSANDVKTEVSAIVASPELAGAAAGDADDVPAPRAVGGPRRLCRKALIGLLLEVLPVAAVALISFALTRARASASPGILPTWGSVILLGPLALAGLVLSGWGWVEIVRSKGKLWGLRFAVPGTLLPVISPCLIAPALFLFARAASPMPPAPRVVLATPPARVPAPEAPVPEPAPAPSDPDYPYWALSHAKGPLGLEQRLALVDPEDLAAIRALDPEERERQAREGRLGLALLPSDALPAPLAEFSRWRIQSSGAASVPVLIGVGNATHTIHFYIVPRVIGSRVRWYFDTASVDIRSKLPSDDE